MRRFGRHDLEMLCVVMFWAFNVTVVKFALAEMAPLAFNMIRFACAALILLSLTRLLEGSLAIDRRDLGRVVALGVVGHTLYQLCFVLGLARTTASSTALIFGASPVVVALMSRVAGHERIDLAGGLGGVLAFVGVFLIVRGGSDGAGHGAAGSSALAGDLLVLAAVFCWTFYTVMSKPLLDRYSPLRVTAVTLSIGAALMFVPALPDLLRQSWGSVTGWTWGGLAYSVVFALVICYVLWYRSVKRVGNLRTAIYSNLVPVFGALFGVWLLGERLSTGVAAGGALILAGIGLTRLRPSASHAPSEAGAAST